MVAVAGGGMGTPNRRGRAGGQRGWTAAGRTVKDVKARAEVMSKWNWKWAAAWWVVLGAFGPLTCYIRVTRCWAISFSGLEHRIRDISFILIFLIRFFKKIQNYTTATD